SGLFTDLDPSQSPDGVHVLSEPGRLVVSWSQVALFGSITTETFQVRLYPDGRIEIAYHGINVPEAVVGITPGGRTPVTLIDLMNPTMSTLSGGIADIFANIDSVDIVTAAQKFYQTHDDAYDYLIFYNAENVAAGSGVVAYEATVRSTGKGYGDGIYDY